MMPSTIRELKPGARVLLTSGKFKDKLFKKESSTIFVQVWNLPSPRPKAWSPIRITSLEVIAGRPELVH